MGTIITDLLTILKRSSDAYYNGNGTGTGPIIDDETFDTMVEKLRELDPENPFLKTVGAPPAEGAITLPYTMPSLEKIKPGQDGLRRFIMRAPAYVLSEKLDGLSALWCSNAGALYLRGDGAIGQTITQFAKGIQGTIHPAIPCVVRGELIIPRVSAAADSKGLRAIVNGLLHQKKPDPEKLSQIHFVAYEVVSPTGLTRRAQFEWLARQGFEVPWWSATAALTEEACSIVFQERRAQSRYETDGIVIGIDQVCERSTAIAVAGTPVKPPKDCMAFKMAVADQSAVTTVRAVLWAASAQGYLIPRLQFDPIQINGATIEFCTGHNARTIVQLGIGPNAMIRIRRSGDVIPTLDAVLLPATPFLPIDAESWVWAEGLTHICTKTKTSEQVTAQLLHFAKTLDIPGLGPANCKTLVEGGIASPATLWRASEETLCGLLGPKSGKTLHETLRTGMATTAPSMELKFLIASSKLPRGTGEAKLKTLFQMYPDPTSWAHAALGAAIPPGWTETTFRDFQQAFPDYEAWRRAELFWIPYPIPAVAVAPVVAASILTAPKAKGKICFTGFRNKELEAAVTKKGYEVVSTLSSTVKILVIADGATESSSEKMKKARATNTIEIIECSEFIGKYMSR